jgi:aldehyde dehydrogenase (NAD+)
VESAVNGAFFSTGQRCTASSRLIVTKESTTSSSRRWPKAQEPGGGRRLKVGTQIGPVVDKNQLNQDLFTSKREKEGAKLTYGGKV